MGAVEWVATVVALGGLAVFIIQRGDKKRALLIEFMHTKYELDSRELDEILNQIEALWGHRAVGRVHALRDVLRIVRKNHADSRLGPICRGINYSKLDKLRWQLCKQMRTSLWSPIITPQPRLQVEEFKREYPSLKRLLF